MIKPSDYESVKAATHNSQPPLPAGGHICQIIKAECVTEDYNGEKVDKLYVYFDVKEGTSYDGYFEQKFKLRRQYNPATKWGGLLRQAIKAQDGSTSPYFKGLITSIEDSNPGFSWQWDERQLHGKRVGIVFREKEFLSNGNKYTTTEPAWACGADEAFDQPIPKKKELNPQAVFGSKNVQDMTPEPDPALPWE